MNYHAFIFYCFSSTWYFLSNIKISDSLIFHSHDQFVKREQDLLWGQLPSKEYHSLSSLRDESWTDQINSLMKIDPWGTTATYYHSKGISRLPPQRPIFLYPLDISTAVLIWNSCCKLYIIRSSSSSSTLLDKFTLKKNTAQYYWKEKKHLW